MHSPAWALAWQIWRPHRWLFLSLVGYLLVLSVLAQVCPGWNLREGPAPLALLPGLVGFVPVLLVSFTYADADVAAKYSSFPAWMFTLPVWTVSLALWPMLYGTATVSLLWVIAAWLILRPGGLPAPLAWPACLLAAVLVWIQALCWWPFGLPVLRMVAACVVLAVVGGGPLVLALCGVGPAWLVLLSVGFAAVGGVTAHRGLVRARHGEEPDWSWLFRLAGRVRGQAARPRPPFRSAARALLWLEWRRNGWFLPFCIGILLPICTVLIPFERGKGLAVLAVLAGLTLFLAGLIGRGLGKPDFWAKDGPIPPFFATRPVSTLAMIRAKYQVAALSTLATWGLILAAVPLWVLLHGLPAETRTWLSEVLRPYSTGQVALLAVGVPAALVFFTWKQLVDGMWVGLLGRPWIAAASTFAGLALLCGLSVGGIWLGLHPEDVPAALAALPWVEGGLLVLKLVAAGIILRALYRQRLLKGGTIFKGLAAWCLLAGTLAAVVAWLTPAGPVGVPAVVFGVLLGLPLTRVSAGPLALAWNRHR